MLLKYKKRKNINKQIAGKWTCKWMQGIFDYPRQGNSIQYPPYLTTLTQYKVLKIYEIVFFTMHQQVISTKLDLLGKL